MERLKYGYLNAFLNRTKLNPETCARAIVEWDSRAREFYGRRLYHDRSFFDDESRLYDSSIFNDESRRYDRRHHHDPIPFLEMILVDSCFINEVIWRYTCTGVQEEADFLSQPRIILDARRDMILLDNQIPFFVLEALFNLGFPSTDRSFIHLAIIYLSEFMLFADSSQALESIKRQPPSEINDFIHLLRICHAPLVPRQPPTDLTKLVAMQRATQLEEAGMIIKPSNSSVCSIQYSRGVLQIPKLKINDKSESLLNKLIEVELREGRFDTYIIDYLHFMDGLIDTSKDVDILIKNGVIENFLSDSKAVATLFNSITAAAPLYPPSYYYYGICESLNDYCKVRRHRWRATFKRDYCSSPWRLLPQPLR